MLLKKHYQVRSYPINYMRIHQLECAFDDTFVLLTQGKEKEPNTLSHVDKKGKVIRFYQFSNRPSVFVMLSDHELVVPIQLDRKIVAIDLKSHHDVDPQYFDATFKERKMKICVGGLVCFFFERTKLLCIIEESQQFNREQYLGHIKSECSVKYFQTPLKL